MAGTMQRPPWSLSFPIVTAGAASQFLQWPFRVLRTLVRKPGRFGLSPIVLRSIGPGTP